MKTNRLSLIASITLAGLVLTLWYTGAFAQMEIKAPVLTGKLWVKMSSDHKTAYIWGMGDIIDLEQELMEILPELKRDSFVTKAVEGIGDVKINDIVFTIDKFYTENPDKIELSVITVMWETMIKPKIKTGIGGKPLD